MYGKVAAETTIRVPHELKDELNELKSTNDLYASTPHEVIKKLIKHYHTSKQTIIDLKASHERKLEFMIEVGGIKERFIEVKADLGLRTDEGVTEFLIDNYQGSMQLGMGAFDTYKRLRGQGK